FSTRWKTARCRWHQGFRGLFSSFRDSRRIISRNRPHTTRCVSSTTYLPTAKAYVSACGRTREPLAEFPDRRLDKGGCDGSAPYNRRYQGALADRHRVTGLTTIRQRQSASALPAPFTATFGARTAAIRCRDIDGPDGHLACRNGDPVRRL